MGQASAVEALKAAAAQAAASLVEEGMVVGLGSGSTAALAVDAIGRRVRDGLRIVGIPTSERTAQQARALGIPISSLAEHDRIHLTIDGADEVEIGTLNLIKGHGGALLREKIVATATEKLIIVVDRAKLVQRLGARFPVPVEVIPFAWQTTAARLRRLGAVPQIRLASDGEPFLTDGGHYILDCAFGAIDAPEQLEQELSTTVGVIEDGLFLGMTSGVVVGDEAGVRTLCREA